MRVKKSYMRAIAVAAGAFVLMIAATEMRLASADDWPQWRGPQRDGTSSETGFAKTWPSNGPKVVWRAKSGDGYSAISVSNGRLYTMWGEGNFEYLFCFNAADGKEIWRYKMGTNVFNDQGSGPRATPIVDDGMIYAIGARGNLHAVNAGTGAHVWSHDMEKEYDARIPRWGYSGSPLIEGNRVFVEIGGKRDYAFGAFDKKTGKLLWHSESRDLGYSSPLGITVNGRRQIVFFTANGLVAVAPENGKLLWDFAWTTSYDVNSAMPIFIAPNKLYLSSGYGVGAAVIQIDGSGDRFSVKQMWRSKEMKNRFNSSVMHGDYIYGFDEAIFKCIDARTGEEKWKARGFSKGQLILADGHLIVLGEQGNLAIVEATPVEYREKASTQILTGKCWTVPSLANGRLYLRNQSEMLCVDLRASAR